LPSSPSTIDAPSSKRDRLWVYGGLIVLVAITGYGAWMLTRSQGATAPHERPPPLAAPTTLSAPTMPPAPPAATAPATSEAPAPRIPSAAPGAALPATATPAAVPAPSPTPEGLPSTDNPGVVAAPAAVASPAVAPVQQVKGIAHPRPKRRHVRRDDGAGPKDPGEKASGEKVPAGAPSAEKKVDPFE